MSDSHIPALSPHCEEILEQYRTFLPVFAKMEEVIPTKLKEFFVESGIIVAALEHRLKTESSLAGKLQLCAGDGTLAFHIGAKILRAQSDTDKALG